MLVKTQAELCVQREAARQQEAMLAASGARAELLAQDLEKLRAQGLSMVKNNVALLKACGMEVGQCAPSRAGGAEEGTEEGREQSLQHDIELERVKVLRLEGKARVVASMVERLKAPKGLRRIR